MSLPYDYYPLILQAIDTISQGRTRTYACDKHGLHIATFEDYIERDEMLGRLVAVAERRGHDALADALVEIDSHKLYGHSDAKMAKVISDNIKWLLDKRDKKRYGERLVVDVNHTADKEIIRALQAGKERIARIAISDNVVDAVAVEIPADDDALMAHILS